MDESQNKAGKDRFTIERFFRLPSELGQLPTIGGVRERSKQVGYLVVGEFEDGRRYLGKENADGIRCWHEDKTDLDVERFDSIHDGSVACMNIEWKTPLPERAITHIDPVYSKDLHPGFSR